MFFYWKTSNWIVYVCQKCSDCPIKHFTASCNLFYCEARHKMNATLISTRKNGHVYWCNRPGNSIKSDDFPKLTTVAAYIWTCQTVEVINRQVFTFNTIATNWSEMQKNMCTCFRVFFFSLAWYAKWPEAWRFLCVFVCRFVERKMMLSARSRLFFCISSGQFCTLGLLKAIDCVMELMCASRIRNVHPKSILDQILHAVDSEWTFVPLYIYDVFMSPNGRMQPSQTKVSYEI